MTPPVDAEARGVEGLRHEVARRTGFMPSGAVMDQILSIAEERLAAQATALAASQARVADLTEALHDATASLAGTVSAYEKYVGRYAHKGARDPLFSTRYGDMQKAVELARAACVSAGASDGGQHG